MLKEEMKKEAQHKKELADLKLSLSNMMQLNETISKEQGSMNTNLQNQHEKLKKNSQVMSKEQGRLKGLNEQLKQQLAEMTKSKETEVGQMRANEEGDTQICELQSQIKKLQNEKIKVEQALVVL